MKVGLCTIALNNHSIFDAISMAADAGFDGIEVWGKPAHMPFEYDADHVARVRDAAGEAGVEIAVFGSYVRGLADDYDGLSANALKIAEGLGTSLIRIWSAQGKPGTLCDADYAKSVQQCKEFCKKAADSGITLVVEHHDNYIIETAAAMLRWLDDVDEDNLKVNWQPSWLDETDDFYVSLATLMPNIANVHAQNFAGWQNRALLAEGDVDYVRVVSELRGAGFDGYLEVEFLADGEPLEMMKKDCAYLKSLVME
jgi:sugar phosphate isomerase/epimerase